jgi:hypothetical protein
MDTINLVSSILAINRLDEFRDEIIEPQAFLVMQLSIPGIFVYS